MFYETLTRKDARGNELLKLVYTTEVSDILYREFIEDATPEALTRFRADRLQGLKRRLVETILADLEVTISPHEIAPSPGDAVEPSPLEAPPEATQQWLALDHYDAVFRGGGGGVVRHIDDPEVVTSADLAPFLEPYWFGGGGEDGEVPIRERSFPWDYDEPDDE